jgi:hypothetical protein
MYSKEVGSRAEVGHGNAHRTSGGLVQSDLVLGDDGVWKSKKKAGKVPHQLKPFLDAHAKMVKKVKPGADFDKFLIKKGTPAYAKFMREAKKLAK